MNSGKTPSQGLVARNLAAFRGERLVFDGLDFALPAGRALLLTGPNGSGKSTLLRLIAGLVRADAGNIELDGDDLLAEPARHVAYLGHQDAIKPGLTVRENLGLASTLARRPSEPALEALALEDLADLPARLLSAGQRRRLALARLALSPRRIWLLDEPTLGLDTASVARLGTVLAAHLAAGGYLLAATHLPLPLAAPLELSLA